MTHNSASQSGIGSKTRIHRSSFAGLAPLCFLLALVCYFPLGCAVGSGSAALPSAAQANQASTSTGVVTPGFFGLVVKDQAHRPTVASGARRLWDSGVTWAAVEPASGSYVWSTLDAEVSSAEAAGAEVTLTLGMTPTWASSQPLVSSAYGAGATALPAHLADWDAYLTAVATRYKGRIAGYEVWNAPSNPTYWGGSQASIGADMAELSARAASAIHAVDPNAAIIAPALDADGMRQFLAAGGDASVAVLTVGASLAGQAPEALVSELASIRSAMTGSQAQTKPLWNDQPSWTLPKAGLSDQEQAGYVARSLILNASFGISRLAWYAWDENQATALRLTDSTGQPTPAAAAYSTAQGWLSGAQINGCAANAQQVWSCQVVRGSRTGWILWSVNGAQQTSTLGMTTSTDLLGHTEMLDQTGWIAVTGSPILLQ